MSKIAIAGGSIGIGRSIADALDLASPHQYIILSRRTSGPKARAVDYSHIGDVAILLESEQIDTVISALPISDDDSGQAQLNLIEAANRSPCTKRFLPSEFGMQYTPENIEHVPSYQWKLRAVEALENSSLQFSLISIGLFLDYWSTPRIPSRLANTPIMWLDLENNFATIPGDGNAPMVLTHSSDAARYVVSLLDLPDWKRRYYIVGTRITLNEAVNLAEEVKGVKFDVHYNSLEDLQRGQVVLTPRLEQTLPSNDGIRLNIKAMVAKSGISLLRGDLDLNPDEGLTLEIPNIKPLSVQEVFEICK